MPVKHISHVVASLFWDDSLVDGLLFRFLGNK